MDLLFGLITSLFLTMILIPPLIRSAASISFIDLPNERKVHQTGIPRIGGLAMVCGALVSVLLWCELDRFAVSYLIGAGILFVFGVLDDVRNLNYKIKFGGQLLAVLLPVVYGGVKIVHFPFLPLDMILPDYLAIPFTIFVLLGITNAINLSDGLDGLAGGTTLLALGVIVVLGYLGNGISSMLISLAVIGSIAGFLRYNTHPAQVFMGDSGSQFLGFSAGLLAIHVTQNVNTALSAALPLLILGLPVLDTLTVMIQRISEKRSPFSPDQNHIHHKLLKLHFDHHEAVFFIYVVQSGLILGAYLLRYESDLLITGLYMLFCLAIVWALRQAEAKGWRAHAPATPAQSHLLTRYIIWLRDRQRLSQWSLYTVALVLPAYLIAVAVFSGRISIDITMLTLLMLGILLAAALLNFRRHNKLLWLERVCIYITISIFVYLIETAADPGTGIRVALNAMLAAIALAVAVNIRYAQQKNFEPTPLDYLVVFLALVMSFSPITLVHGVDIGVGLIKLIILFYGAELLINRVGPRQNLSRLAVYCSLSLVGIKGIVAL